VFFDVGEIDAAAAHNRSRIRIIRESIEQMLQRRIFVAIFFRHRQRAVQTDLQVL